MEAQRLVMEALMSLMSGVIARPHLTQVVRKMLHDEQMEAVREAFRQFDYSQVRLCRPCSASEC